MQKIHQRSTQYRERKYFLKLSINTFKESAVQISAGSLFQTLILLKSIDISDFLRRRFDVCALSETKLKGIGEVMFGEVVGRVSGFAAGRAREGVALLLWAIDEVCSRMEGGVIQTYVG